MHDRKIDSGLFPDLATSQNAGVTSTTGFSDPRIFTEFPLAINVLNGFGDADLSFTEHLFHLNTHRVISIHFSRKNSSKRPFVLSIDQRKTTGEI
jgi:hypothetical protein